MHNSVDNVENFLPLGVDVDGDLLDRLIENRIGFHLLFDLLERVDDGRMIALAEFAANVRRGEIRHAANEIHRRLTGVDHLTAAGGAFDDLFVDAEIARGLGDDHGGRGGKV